MILRIFCLFLPLAIVITPQLHWSSGNQNFTPSQLSHPILRSYPSVDLNYTTAKIEVSRRNQEQKFRYPRNATAETSHSDPRGSRLDPMKCYTCRSLVSSSSCGVDFTKMSFKVKECGLGKRYCMKLIEITEDERFMLRKCTDNTCEEERQERQGQMTDCFVCDHSLCNKGPPLRSTTIFFSAVASYYFWYHYISS